MISALIGAFVAVVVAGIIWWAITELLKIIPLPEPFARIAYILLVVILVLIVLYVILTLLGAAGVAVPHWIR